MNQFYIGIMFLGISLIVASLVLIIFDKKNSFNYAARLEEEKNELNKVINDSEDMIVEFNRISEYVINLVEEKSSQLNNLLKNADDQIVNMKPITMDINEKKLLENEINEKKINEKEKNEEKNIEKKSNIESELSGQNATSERVEIQNINYNRVNNNMNIKRIEVLDLFGKGYSDMEIAKALKIGKGEVQLILGMHINKIKIGS